MLSKIIFLGFLFGASAHNHHGHDNDDRRNHHDDNERDDGEDYQVETSDEYAVEGRPLRHCVSEIGEYCPEGNKLSQFGCLLDNEEDLSDECLSAIVASKLYACSDDLLNFCAESEDLFELADCLDNNYYQLSSNCTQVVDGGAFLYQRFEFSYQSHVAMLVMPCLMLLACLCCCRCMCKRRRRRGACCGRRGYQRCNNSPPQALPAAATVVMASAAPPAHVSLNMPAVVPVASVVGQLPQQHAPAYAAGRYVYQPGA